MQELDGKMPMFCRHMVLAECGVDNAILEGWYAYRR